MIKNQQLERFWCFAVSGGLREKTNSKQFAPEVIGRLPQNERLQSPKNTFFFQGAMFVIGECNLIYMPWCFLHTNWRGQLWCTTWKHVDDLLTAASKIEVFVEDICLVLGVILRSRFQGEFTVYNNIRLRFMSILEANQQLYMIFGYNRVKLQQYYRNPPHIFPWPVVGQHKDGRAHHPAQKL